MSEVKQCQLEFNPLSASPTKWPNTLKQFVGKSQHMTYTYLEDVSSLNFRTT